MTKVERAARKPLLAKIRRMKEAAAILVSRADRYYADYRIEVSRNYEAREEMRRVLNKAPGTKFWMEDQNRTQAGHAIQYSEHPPTISPLPNGGIPPRAPRQ